MTYRLTTLGETIEKLMEVEENQDAFLAMEQLVGVCVETYMEIQSCVDRSTGESSESMDEPQARLRRESLDELQQAKITLLPLTLWEHREKLGRFLDLEEKNGLNQAEMEEKEDLRMELLNLELVEPTPSSEDYR